MKSYSDHLPARVGRPDSPTAQHIDELLGRADRELCRVHASTGRERNEQTVQTRCRHLAQDPESPTLLHGGAWMDVVVRKAGFREGHEMPEGTEV